MKAVQIKGYSKNINTTLNDIPIPQISDSEVLIQVKAAAVNPVELLILTGSVKLIQDYPMPLTLGNECSGIVEQVGSKVRDFQKGDRVYTRLPINKIGAFAEYVAVEQDAIAKMPEGYDFNTAAAIPLTGLTAYQAIVEELEAKSGETILIPGGSGSFGQMAVPIAKALGLRVIVTGNARAKEQFLAMGVDRYLDYKTEHYWEVLSDMDHVIDTLGPSEFERELAVLKKGGRLVSLRTGPNKAFALRHPFGGLKKQMFTLAGSKFDKAAQKQGKEYRFVFVRSNGAQLQKITEIVEKQQVKPAVDARVFSLDQANEALHLVAKGQLNGKVMIQL
ncbi:NADP-dependent oxidoreductase [Pseudoflavonifractor sp. MCC625]|uniref:NADP-dependent oxidoreductase n=1 Tax=Pseudoflavonifractor sp. MCC625 TaxID=2592647 RepID=UPI001C018E4E|nr:NADP-dependent oxidoreductase [Pseudoflavonifractor sp. MCC625]MBT9684241.1 zinc-binding dehydrogenase [Pseudoflavonifractor sp. MCC625]